MIRIAYYTDNTQDDGALTMPTDQAQDAQRAALLTDGADAALVAAVVVLSWEAESHDDAIIEADVPAALVPWLESHRMILD